MKRIYSLTVFLVVTFFLMTNSYAQTYFVKRSGNDSANGLSDATAWKSITKVNNFSFKPGDDVYFKCDNTWTTSGNNVLRVNWTGTSSNRATLGAYYMSGGNETIGVRGTKPTINGGSFVSGSYPNWRYVVVSPTDYYKGLIHIDGSGISYFDLENFRTINSGGYGIWSAYGSHRSIKNCYVGETRASGIQLKNTSHTTVANNELYHVNRVFAKAGGDNDHTPAGIGAINMDNCLIEKNYVHEGWGEGIGFFYGSENNIIQYNKVVDHMRAGIYGTSVQNNIIRYNLVYGTGNEIYTRSNLGGKGYVAAGLWRSDESSSNVTKYGASTGNEWYGNLVANTSDGFKISVSHTGASFNNSKVYNNTFVGNYYQITGYGFVSSKVSNSEIKNNIFWNSDNTALDNGWPSKLSGLTFDYNLWCSVPSSALVQGPNDIIQAAPLLNKTTGWQNDKHITIADFEPRHYSYTGQNLGAPYDIALSVNSDFAAPIIVDLGSQSNHWARGGVLRNGGLPLISDGDGGLKPPTLQILSN